TQKLHFIKDLSDVVLNLKALEPKADDEKSITLLKNVIDNFINKSNKNNGIEEQTKKAVFDLLNNLNTKEPKALKETISQFTDIEQKVLKDIEGLNNSKLLNFSLSELKKSIKTIDQKGIAAIDIQKLKDIGDTLTKGILKSDTTIETKVSVQSLLNNLNNITKEPTEQPSAQILNNILSNTVKLEQILNHTPIHKHINPKVIESSSIKNLTSDLNSLIDLVKSISNKPIDNTHISQLQNITQNLSKEISSLDIKVEVKTAVHNLLNNLNTVVENQKLQPAPLQLQTITNEAVKINTLLSKTAGALNNISEPQLQNQLDITKDIKAALLIIQENGNSDQSDLSKELKATVDKLISQIEFFQGLSYTSAANYTFVPFSWENMEDGDIRFSSNKDDNFSCQINLNLKNYGELKILLDLESKNYININVGVQSEILRGMFQKNLQKLRIGINRIDLNLQSLNIFDLNELKEKKEITDIYNGNESLNFGLDLKV
ncbi:MAG: hypothetical protein U9Q33_12825, partial [Campylobacterota bacterium]|nr:hypothetical protein [Campylobacterota bacterium]